MCKSCKRQFLAGNRIDNAVLWQEYTLGKQTYKQLSIKYNLSIKTIQRHLDLLEHSQVDNALNTLRSACVIMGTTYFGHDFGLMVWMDNATGHVLTYQIVKYETNSHYKQGIAKLQAKGLIIHSITMDGRRGLLGGFADIPTQMCQFHQIRIITRYLTKRPKHPASIELKAIANGLTKSTKNSFSKALDDWYLHHQAYLNERSVNEMGKSWYTHKKLRSAYKSLRSNLPYLFTYQEHPTKNTPNTTNRLEGLFSSLKQSLGCHQGLNQQRKLKFIDDFMKRHQL